MGYPWGVRGVSVRCPWADRAQSVGYPVGGPWGVPGAPRGVRGLGMGCSWGAHRFSVDCPRAIAWVVYAAQPWVAHGLPMSGPRVAHELPMGCPLVAHGMSVDCSWTVPWVAHWYTTNCPCVAHKLPMGCRWGEDAAYGEGECERGHPIRDLAAYCCGRFTSKDVVSPGSRKPKRDTWYTLLSQRAPLDAWNGRVTP